MLAGRFKRRGGAIGFEEADRGDAPAPNNGWLRQSRGDRRGAAGLRARTMPRLLMVARALVMSGDTLARAGAVNRTGVRLRPCHREAEHQRQDRRNEAHRFNNS
jgi:hypothetical protein